MISNNIYWNMWLRYWFEGYMDYAMFTQMSLQELKFITTSDSIDSDSTMFLILPLFALPLLMCWLLRANRLYT